MIKYFFYPSLVLLPLAQVCGQVYTHVDLTSLLDYDAVGTSSEIAVQASDSVNPYTLADRIGNHSIGNKIAFINQDSLTTGTGLPANGILMDGKYQISTAYDDPDAGFLVKSNNAIQMSANNTLQMDVLTVNLAPEQQGQYSAFNMTYLVNRSSTLNNAQYSSKITVFYTDASSEVIMLTTATGDGSVDRGTFGSSNWQLSSDDYTFTNEAPDRGETVSVSNVISNSRILGLTGSGASQRSTISSSTGSLWEFGSDIPIDDSKVLSSIEVAITRGGGPTSNRNNTLYVFGMTLVTVPEPQTYALLFGVAVLGVVGVLRRRR